ncbi:MAG: MarR family winged helix-turn-helix transcriptional regulator [Roseovarius indicus]
MLKLMDILDGTSIPVNYRMAFITNFYREPLLRRMERETGMIRPELTVLMCLSHRSGLNARDICEITEQPSNTVSRAVGALVGKGYVTRTRDAVDTRRNVLAITEAGKAVHDRVMATFAEAERVMLETLEPEEVETLTRLLDKLARDVERWAPGLPAKVQGG